MTPVNSDALHPNIFGSIGNQILEILGDKKGYYLDELQTKIDCHEKSLYRALSQLKQKKLILSKTMPNASKKLGRPANAQIYFLNPQAKDLR